MKLISVVLLIAFTNYSVAENVKCPVENFVVFPRDVIKLLKQFPLVFMTIKISNKTGSEKPVIIKIGSESESHLSEGQSFGAGDIIKTKPGQTVELNFFMPTAQTITIGENSEVRIRELATLKCQSAFEILKGSISSEGTHAQNKEIQDCAAEIQTQNSDVRPTGTKYSIDLSEAIAEASGEAVQTENYSVEKGSIEVRLKRVIPISKSKSFRLSKNGSFQLKQGQKATVKTNSKTKVADVQIVEP